MIATVLTARNLIVHGYGAKVHAQRTGELMSLRQLAERTGVAASVLSGIETGRMIPTDSEVDALADWLLEPQDIPTTLADQLVAVAAEWGGRFDDTDLTSALFTRFGVTVARNHVAVARRRIENRPDRPFKRLSRSPRLDRGQEHRTTQFVYVTPTERINR